MSKFDYPEEVEKMHMNILNAVAGIEIDRLRELTDAERDGRVRFVKDDDDRCLNCVSYLGVCECTAIGYCGGTNFYCNWFEHKPKAAEAALAGKEDETHE